MKLYEIEHINQKYNPNKVMGEELRFTHSFCSTSGKMYDAEKQPEDWDHVKRLTHMLFLAWNDKNPIEGVVYLGSFESETEETKFYRFFEKFNKFPINGHQKRMYQKIKSGGHTYGDRRVGATVLLLTIAAYEIAKNKTVFYISHNTDASRIYQREFNSKFCDMFDFDLLGGITFTTVNYPVKNLLGIKNELVFILDNWQLSHYSQSDYNRAEYKNILKNMKHTEYSIDTY